MVTTTSSAEVNNDTWCLIKSKNPQKNALFNNFYFQDESLLNIFQNFKIKSNIITYTNISFSNLYGFGVICDEEIKYYAFSVWDNTIVKFDSNWQYVNHTYFELPVFSTTVDKELYVTGSNAMFKIDSNMNILKNYTNIGAAYGGIYYNRTTDHIIVTADSYSHLDVFDRNLTLVGTIDTTPLCGSSLYFQKGRLYAGTGNGNVFVIEDESMIYSFSTVCVGYIGSVLVDDNDCLAVACMDDRTVYLYHTNGTYMNISQYVGVQPIQFGYDARGNFILVSFSGIYFLDPTVTDATTTVTDATTTVTDVTTTVTDATTTTVPSTTTTQEFTDTRCLITSTK
jgi:hypothetical protein